MHEKVLDDAQKTQNLDVIYANLDGICTNLDVISTNLDVILRLGCVFGGFLKALCKLQKGKLAGNTEILFYGEKYESFDFWTCLAASDRQREV